MRANEWNYYGAPDSGVYVVGDYIYEFKYSYVPGSLDTIWIIASPSADYGPAKKHPVADQYVKAITAEIGEKGRKLSSDAEIQQERNRITQKRNAPRPPAAPPGADTSTGGGTSLIPTWIYDPSAAWYQQGYFYALVATGGIVVVMNWDTITKKVTELMGGEAAAPALANPRKNKMKKYSNPRMNRKHRRKNREEEVEEEVEEIDEDEE